MSGTLEHDALIYRTPDEFLAATVPFLRAGIQGLEGVVVATTDRNRALLESALGAAASQVMFVAAGDVYRSPAAAIAAYHGVIDTFLRQGKKSVRAIGEVAYGEDRRAHESWLRYEPVAHAIFQDAPLHAICPYDATVLPARLIDHAARTHPHLLSDEHRQSNTAFIRPDAMLRMLPEMLSHEPHGAPDLSVGASGDDIVPVRRMVAEALASRLTAARAEEAMIAIGELLSNGVRHGRGRVSAALWTRSEVLVVRVHNEGPPIDDPYAGYHPPEHPASGGMGLWIARQFADELAIRHDARGPIVTMVVRR